ncbi:MAG: DUF721 domain-containing protein [Pseudomonadota bacterium]
MRRPTNNPQAAEFRTRPVRRAAPSVSKSLGPHIARLAKASGAMDPRLASEWPKIAGPELAPLCRPIRIISRGRTQALELSVKSGAAAMKIQYAQEALLGRVRQRLGLPRLSRIVIRQGAEVKAWASQRLAAETPAPKPAPKSPSRLDEALTAMRRSFDRKGE